MPKQRLFAVSALFAVGCGAASAQLAQTQLAQRSNEVSGLSGMVNVLPNKSAGQTTVAFASYSPLNATSSQIIFVMQETNAAVPPAWSGPARVLTGDGFVAIVSANRPKDRWLLKFTDRDVPPSLANLGFQVFNVYGIARYGEKTPLTSQQISTLASTGSLLPANRSLP